MSGVLLQALGICSVALRTGEPVVRDAGALTVFEDTASLFYETITGPCVIALHDGEFAKVLPDLGDVDRGEKIAKVHATVKLSGAVIRLKKFGYGGCSAGWLGGGA